LEGEPRLKGVLKKALRRQNERNAFRNSGKKQALGKPLNWNAILKKIPESGGGQEVKKKKSLDR